MAEVEATATVSVQGLYSGAATGDPEDLKEAFKAFLSDLRDACGEENVSGSIVILGESLGVQDFFPPEPAAAPAAEPEPATASAKTSKSSEG